MKKIKLSLKNGEKIHLNEINCISFGILDNDKWHANRDLFIISDRGNLRFNLAEISSIEFYIEQEKRMLFVSSRAVEEGEKDGKI